MGLIMDQLQGTILPMFSDGLLSIESWLNDGFVPAVVVVIVAASAVYLSFIAWRAFKAATNKV